MGPNVGRHYCLIALLHLHCARPRRSLPLLPDLFSVRACPRKANVVLLHARGTVSLM
jgi:hypothetical protein